MGKSMEFIGLRNVECRTGIRVPVRLPVTIEIRPLVLRVSLRAVTHNVSFDGALVEACKPDLPKGAQVRVLLETAPTVQLFIDAVVVRSTDKGVALMFTEYADDVLKPLSAILAAEFNKYLDGRLSLRTVANAEPFATSVGMYK